MKKQLVILLSVVCALCACLFLAACGQQQSGAASSTAAASSEVSAESTAQNATEATEAAGEYTGLPAFQPVDHEGRSYEQCPTCHNGSTAPAIPDDHYINGELDGARLQCVTCHVVEPAA